MNVTVKQCDPPADMNIVATDNSIAIQKLIAGKLFVDIHHNSIPTESLKKGMPIIWGDKPMSVPILPNWNNFSG